MRPLKWLQPGYNKSAAQFYTKDTTLGGGALITFVILYGIAVIYCHQSYSRDPTSFFFDSAKGYEARYSRIRHEEALRYIAEGYKTGLEHAGKLPTTCIGISSTGVPGEQTVKATIGSLLAGLDGRERKDIYLIVHIANTDPHDHPIYKERWLKDVVDKVLTYDSVHPDAEYLQQLEQGEFYEQKAILDYAFLLDECYKTGASLIAMIEDDVIALYGWYARALKASSDVDDHDGLSSWLYLRLFYTEKLLGWRNEE